MKLASNTMNISVAALALTLSVASFGQGRGLSTGRMEMKTGERVNTPSAKTVNPEGLKAIEGSVNSANEAAKGLTELDSNVSVTKNLTTEQKFEIHAELGDAGAQEISHSYANLTSAAKGKDGDNALAKFVVDAMTSAEWTSCTACQTGLANKLNQSANLAINKSELAPKEALHEVMARDGSLKKYEESCSTNPLKF